MIPEAQLLHREVKPFAAREPLRKKVAARNPVVSGVRFVARWVFFLILTVVGMVFGRFLRPNVIFCVYGTDRDRSHYWPTKLQWMLPVVVTIGVIVRKAARGFVLGYPRGYENLLNNKEELARFLAGIRKLYPKAGKIALAGTLPMELEAKHIKLDDPFVLGRFGTVYTMKRASLKLAEMVGKPFDRIRFAILGGGGFIGAPLAEELANVFGEVISFDPKFSSIDYRGKNKRKYLRTYDVKALEGIDAAIVLTRKGDNIRGYAWVFGPGVVIGDDTHPCMGPDLVRQLREQGVRLVKISNRYNTYTFPNIPNFHNEDVPGCLLEAIVIDEVGDLPTQEDFNRTADGMGIEISLEPHPDM